MSRFPILVSLTLGLYACSSDNERDFLSDADKRQPIAVQFSKIAEMATAEGIIEGIQYSLVEGGEVLAAKAFGLADRESNRSMTTATPINVASIAKPITAWGVIALSEHRSLDLDAPVGELLDDSQLHDELFSGHNVSLRMLLSHTSGLSGPSVPVIPASEAIPGLADILLGKSSLPRASIKRSPGNEFSYSGAGYLVVQQIIEDQARLRFAIYMKSTVLRPAQMLDSTFSLTSDSLDRVAVYYRSDGRRRDPYHLPGAAGGLYSTANDMGRFIVLYTDEGRAARKQIISDEGFATMLSPVTNVETSESRIVELHYGLGHYTYETNEGERIVFHAGGNPGLRSLVVIAPDRNIGFFAVANNDRGSIALSAMLAAWGEHYELTLHSHF